MTYERDQFERWTIGGKEFYPAYTPEKMFHLGVFNHAYFELAIDEDFEGLRPSILDFAKQATGKPNPKLNAFSVQSGQDYGTWFDNGWIFEEDPLGWFHWYCRFISGRRHERDVKQIGRWISYKRWHSRALRIRSEGKVVSGVINQGLLHWSWEVVL